MCFLFCWVLELVTSVATPLYLYFQVLCQVLASNGKREQKLCHAVQKQIMYPSLKNSQKIIRSSFWSILFAQHEPSSWIYLISFDFSYLSNISASINSISADCPVLADCSLVFQSYLLKVFNLGSLLKVPWFELSNSSLFFILKFLMFFYCTKMNLYRLCALTLLMKFMMSYVWRKFSSVTV